MHEISHRRKNILTGEWVQVSPHRNKRPWQGKVEAQYTPDLSEYDSTCYLCPGNMRSNGVQNPGYQSVYVFDNDFSALQFDLEEDRSSESELFVAKAEKGICRVICFSPNHGHTLALMEVRDVKMVVDEWQHQYLELGNMPDINYVQIFENKGEMMGCSNPHPHGQIWAQQSIPMEPIKEDVHQKKYFSEKGRSLLKDYLQAETEKNERIVCQNEHFTALVPFWAVWPFETIVIPNAHQQHIAQMTEQEKNSFADIISRLTIRYDNLFQTSFPYSAGIHQSPTGKDDYSHWHWHMHFYPPLLRSATVKKFMVGYEMMANPQRDITPETAAQMLRNLSEIHYLKTKQ
jgi:UDPglucose--hexose-1-phosphate uridylyltransferase